MGKSKARVLPRFDPAALRRIVGDKIYARGEAYHRQHRVAVICVEARNVLASVQGNETYRVAVTGGGDKLGGSCGCPAFEDFGVCKHMVATALAANELDESSAVVGALPRIRAHLQARGVEALVDMIVEMALEDPLLLDKLDTAATAKTASDEELEVRARRSLDAAIDFEHFVDYRGAGAWADGIADVLDKLDDLLAQGRAGLAMRLAENAIDGMAGMLEDIDDSDDECHAVMMRARDLHLAAALVARPDPVGLAENLFEREIADAYGLFNGAVDHYQTALGEAGLAAYRSLAEKAWAELPSRSASQRQKIDDGAYAELRSILDFFAERDGDVEARLALRTKDLSSQWRYLQLVEFCREQGRHADALQHAEEGLWLFEDEARQDMRLLEATVALLLKARRQDDALAHLRRAFEKSPSLALYQKLGAIGGETSKAAAIAALEARVARKTELGWGVRPAELLVQVLAHEKRWTEAWAASKAPGIRPDVIHALADASETAMPREALPVHAARVEALVQSGGNRDYEAAAKIIGRMAGLRDEPEQAVYVADLRTRYARRRTFMKLLA